MWQKNSLTVNGNTVKAWRYVNLLESIGKVALKTSKTLATFVLNFFGRALGRGAEDANAAVSKNPKAALCIFPGVKSSYDIVEGLYRRNLV